MEAVTTLMAALPTVALRATCEMEGETEIMEGDVSKCKVGFILASHSFLQCVQKDLYLLNQALTPPHLTS